MADSQPVLLVIDDEPGIIALVERFAAGKGFTVISRTDGRGIVAELPTIKADVALVDLRLPGMSGLELLRAMQHADPSLRVILMTGHASVDSAIEAVSSGALDYLSKPLDFDRLNELCHRARRSRSPATPADSRQRGGEPLEFCGMVGRSPSCRSSSTRFAGWRPLAHGRHGDEQEPSHVRYKWAAPIPLRRFELLAISNRCSRRLSTRGAFTGAADASRAVERRRRHCSGRNRRAAAVMRPLLWVVEYGKCSVSDRRMASASTSG